MSDYTAGRLRLPLSPPQAVQSTSAVLWQPVADRGTVGVVLAHGAGTDMTNPVLCSVGKGLAARGYPVLAFNFGYTEAGRKRPDPTARLERAFRDVVASAEESMGRPLVLGGRSMGGRIATHLVAQGTAAAGLLLLGYPLHPRVRAADRGLPIPAERLRTAHWPQITTSALFLQGDRDSLCELAVLEQELHAGHLDARVQVIRGADHGFAVRKSDGRTSADVLAEIIDTAAAWLDRLAEGEEARQVLVS